MTFNQKTYCVEGEKVSCDECMKGGAYGKWRGLQSDMGGERGGATMRSPMCLLMKVVYAHKISAVRWRAVVFVLLYQYRYGHLFLSVPLILLASP